MATKRTGLEMLKSEWGQRLRAVGTLTGAIELLERSAAIEANFSTHRADAIKDHVSRLVEIAQGMAEDAHDRF